jgi:transporter family-2 protein
MQFLYPFAAFVIGIIFAMQPAINGEAARILGSPISASALSVAITLIACLSVLVVAGQLPKTSSIVQLPWWVVLGGLIGLFVVAGGAAIAPLTGAALFFVCLIAGQLMGSVLVDYFGFFGMQARSFNWVKIAGILMALGGVFLVRYS